MCLLKDLIHEQEALNRWKAGEHPSFSSNLNDDFTCGYGKLDAYGNWQFPLYPAEDYLPSGPKEKTWLSL